MRRSINWLAHLTFTLTLASTLGATASTAVAAPLPPIFIHSDGETTVRNGAGQPPVVYPSGAVPQGRTTCPSFSESAQGGVEVDADPKVRYGAFMAVANWLEDCGVRDLKLIGPRTGLGGSTSLGSIDLRMEPQAIGTLYVRCMPAIGAAPPVCPKRAEPIYASLLQDGSLTLVTSEGSKRTDLEEIGGDLDAAVKASSSGEPPILVRADFGVPYAQFIALVQRMHAAGYARIGLINENATGR